jgi:hypothetical protein
MSGWTNSVCTSCGNLNDTFILACVEAIPDADDCFPESDCGSEWAYLFSVPFCDIYGIFLKLLYTADGWPFGSIPAGHYYLLLHIGCSEEAYEYFVLDLGTEKPVCSEAAWDAFTYLGGSICNGGSSVVVSVSIPS